MVTRRVVIAATTVIFLAWGSCHSFAQGIPAGEVQLLVNERAKLLQTVWKNQIPKWSDRMSYAIVGPYSRQRIDELENELDKLGEALNIDVTRIVASGANLQPDVVYFVFDRMDHDCDHPAIRAIFNVNDEPNSEFCAKLRSIDASKNGHILRVIGNTRSKQLNVYFLVNMQATLRDAKETFADIAFYTFLPLVDSRWAVTEATSSVASQRAWNCILRTLYSPNLKRFDPVPEHIQCK